MSTAPVIGWVEAHGPPTNPDYSVLDYLARHASDHKGIDVAYCFPGISTLAEKSRWERKTVMDAIKRLEYQGWLLVRRPADRGSGRHSEYVILMGRVPQAVAAQLGWPCRAATPHRGISLVNGTLDRSVSRTDQQGRGSVAGGVDDGPDPGIHRDSGPNYVHRGVQAAPPAASKNQATAPVDSESPPSADGYAGGTDPPRTGPGPVQDRSAQDGPEVENLKNPLTQVCSPTSPDRARSSAPVDNLVIQQVAERLASLAPTTRWDLTRSDVEQLTVHALRWPDRASAIDDFVASSRQAIAELGPPNSARGWRDRWLALSPPGSAAGDVLCVTHQIPGYDPVPVRVCATCTAASSSKVDS